MIMNRYKDSGLSLDDLRQMPASKVVDLIYPKENLRHKDIPLPDFEKIHEQMIQMGKHADLSFLWIDYKKEHPNGYQLAQFYNAHDGAYYRRWASVYGESMVTLIDRILRSSKHEEQAYNSCAGVLHSCKDVPHRLVQEAAEKCVEAKECIAKLCLRL